LHVGDRVAELGVVIDLDLDRALAEQADLLAKILLAVARRMVDRLDAGVFGDDLRLGRRKREERGRRDRRDDAHELLPLVADWRRVSSNGRSALTCLSMKRRVAPADLIARRTSKTPGAGAGCEIQFGPSAAAECAAAPHASDRLPAACLPRSVTM